MPLIVKELRESEKLGLLQNKVQKAYEELEVIEEASEDIPDESVGFVEDDVERKEEANISNEKNKKLLWESEEKWRLLLENLPNIVLLADHDGTIRYINHTVPGLTPEQVIGKNHLDYIPPEYHDTVKKTIKQVFQTGNIGDYEIKGVGPKGSISWYASRIGPIKSDGQVVAVSIITTDITKKKQTEWELGERLKEFRCLYNITNSIRSEKALEELLVDATRYIREAWQHPEITRCRIRLDDRKYESEKFTETEFKQRADIVVKDKIRGLVEVYYLKEMPEADEGPFLKEERKLLDEIASYFGIYVEKMEVDEEKNKLYHNMSERVRELGCLYGVIKLIENNTNSIDDILQGVVDSIPPSWQYPDVTCARIIFDGKEFKTSNFKETELKQSSEIITDDKKGVIEVHYLEGKPESDKGPFLKEERHLIDGLGIQLGNIIERKLAEEKIQQQNEFLNTVLESLTHPFYVINTNDFSIMMTNTAASGSNSSGKSFHCYELTHKRNEPCDTEEHLCPLKEVVKTKKPVTVEHTHYGKDGNTRIYEVHGFPILDDNGNATQMIEYSLDITARKKTEKELKRKIVELERYKKITVERELKMIELKKRLKELKEGVKR